MLPFLLLFSCLLQKVLSIPPLNNRDGWSCENSDQERLICTCVNDISTENDFTADTISGFASNHIQVQNCKNVKFGVGEYRFNDKTNSLSIKNVEELEFQHTYGNYVRELPDHLTLENINNLKNWDALGKASHRYPLKTFTVINVTLFSPQLNKALTFDDFDWQNVSSNLLSGKLHGYDIKWRNIVIDTINASFLARHFKWDNIRALKLQSKFSVTGHCDWKNVIINENNSTYIVLYQIIWTDVNVNFDHSTFRASTINFTNVNINRLNSTFVNRALINWENVTIGVIDSTFGEALIWRNVVIVKPLESHVRIRGHFIWSHSELGVVPKGFCYINGDIAKILLKMGMMQSGALKVENGERAMSDPTKGEIEEDTILGDNCTQYTSILHPF